MLNDWIPLLFNCLSYVYSRFLIRCKVDITVCKTKPWYSQLKFLLYNYDGTSPVERGWSIALLKLLQYNKLVCQINICAGRLLFITWLLNSRTNWGPPWLDTPFSKIPHRGHTVVGTKTFRLFEGQKLMYLELTCGIAS